MSESQSKRRHRATFSSDKKKGGYLVRVEGPDANRFSGREVPVSKKDGDESKEKLGRLIWSGTDDESGKPVSLYEFEPSPKPLDDEIPF